MKAGAVAGALALPAAIWIVVALVLLVLAPMSLNPFMTPADLTLSEAAATRDHLEILRQMRAGANPDAAARVRAGLVRADEYVLTPLEAAVASGQVDTVQFLQHHGARMDGPIVAALICLADVQQDRQMAAYLREQAPPALAIDCNHVHLPWTD